MRRAATGLLVVLALAVAATGCGGSDNSSDTSAADEWASGFCGAVTDWKNSLKDITSRFDDTSNLSADGVQSAADDARSATDTLISSIKDLGAPDTESGQEAKDAIDSLSTTLDTEMSSIQDTAKGVSSLTEIPGAISTISTSVAAMSAAFSQTLTTISDADTKGELKTAFEDSPDCADLTNDS